MGELDEFVDALVADERARQLAGEVVTAAPTWRELLADAEAQLGPGVDGPPDRRAGVGLRRGRAGDRTSTSAPPTVLNSRWARMVARRRAGEPLQYVVGGWGFRRLDLYVDQRVLIPRPETEQVVEVGVRRVATPRGRARRVVVSTSAPARARSRCRSRWRYRTHEVWATDVSPDALAVARANLAGLGGRAAARVRLSRGTGSTRCPTSCAGMFGCSCRTRRTSPTTTSCRPRWPSGSRRAHCVAGPTGLEAIEVIVSGAPTWLARPAALVVEIAPDQAERAGALARAAGFGEVDVRPDLQGRARALVGRV